MALSKMDHIELLHQMGQQREVSEAFIFMIITVPEKDAAINLQFVMNRLIDVDVA